MFWPRLSIIYQDTVMFAQGCRLFTKTPWCFDQGCPLFTMTPWCFAHGCPLLTKTPWCFDQDCPLFSKTPWCFAQLCPLLTKTQWSFDQGCPLLMFWRRLSIIYQDIVMFCPRLSIINQDTVVFTKVAHNLPRQRDALTKVAIIYQGTVIIDQGCPSFTKTPWCFDQGFPWIITFKNSMGYTVTSYSALIIVHRYPANTYWYNIVPITFHVCVVFEQKTCIYTIFNRLKEFAQRANAPNFVGSRRLVRPKP